MLLHACADEVKKIMYVKFQNVKLVLPGNDSLVLRAFNLKLKYRYFLTEYLCPVSLKESPDITSRKYTLNNKT